MEWISVNDDLPEEGLVVVICGANFGVSLGSLDTDAWVATGLTPKGPRRCGGCPYLTHQKTRTKQCQ